MEKFVKIPLKTFLTYLDQEAKWEALKEIVSKEQEKDTYNKWEASGGIINHSEGDLHNQIEIFEDEEIYYFKLNIGDRLCIGHENYETFIIQSNKVLDVVKIAYDIFANKNKCLSYFFNLFGECSLSGKDLTMLNIATSKPIVDYSPKEFAELFCKIISDSDSQIKLSLKEFPEFAIHDKNLGYGLML